MGKHRGWTVSAPGTAKVSYGSRRQARSVARNVKGAKVSGDSGCPLALLMLPLWPLLVAVHLIAAHLIKTSARHEVDGVQRAEDASPGGGAHGVVAAARLAGPAHLDPSPRVGRAPERPLLREGRTGEWAARLFRSDAAQRPPRGADVAPGRAWPHPTT